MNAFIFLFFLFSSFIYAGEDIEIELDSGNIISIDTYKANSETLFLQLPSERGLDRDYISIAQQLAFNGYDVWAVDLHNSYIISKYCSSINRFNIDDLFELIADVNKKSFKNIFFLTSGSGAQLALKISYQWQLKNPNSSLLKGYIFHSPHLVDDKHDFGSVTQYINIAKYSNLPIYILLPQFGTKFLRGNEIAMQLMKIIHTPKILITDKDLTTNIKVTLAEPILKKYHGK